MPLLARTLTTNPGTLAQRERSSHKPNAARKIAIRYSLAGLKCMSCNLSGCWHGVDLDGVTGPKGFGNGTPRQDAHAFHCGHVKGETVGGTWTAGNIGPQHKACNLAAKHAGIEDLTGLVIADNVPTLWTPNRVALDKVDVRRDPMLRLTADDAPTIEAMAAARRRLGLPY